MAALPMCVLPLGLLAVALCLLLLAVRRRRRRRRRESATCWFCQGRQPQGCPSSGWSCVHCSQYNGFKQDGSYDREIPAMMAETPSPRYCQGLSQWSASRQVLCPQCQNHLQMKVAQLASFSPTSEERFEEEAREYEQQVERLYPLCTSCEKKAADEISRKNRIIRNKLLPTLMTPLSPPPPPPLSPPLPPLSPSPPASLEVHEFLSALSIRDTNHKNGNGPCSWLKELEHLNLLTTSDDSQPHLHDVQIGTKFNNSLTANGHPTSTLHQHHKCLLRPTRFHYRRPSSPPSSPPIGPYQRVSKMESPSLASSILEPPSVAPPTLGPPSTAPPTPAWTPPSSEPRTVHCCTTLVITASVTSNVVLLWLLLMHTDLCHHWSLGLLFSA